MTDNYLNLTLQSFLDVITDTENVYNLKIGKEKISGTRTEVEIYLKEIASDELKEIFKSYFDQQPEYIYEFELSQIEIYNYLEKITGNFDIKKVRMTLFDIEVYYHMDFLERIKSESHLTYQIEGWEIPMKDIEMKLSRKKEVFTSLDYDTMLAKTHPFAKENIRSAMSLLKRKMENFKTHSVEKINPHPRIFINKTAFELFEHLKETVENEHADYSFIFRVMQKDEYIYPDISESAFRDWLGKHYSIILSKLKTYEYCFTPSKESFYKLAKQFNK